MKPKRSSVRDRPPPDDVSVSESICSGVLDEYGSGGGRESGAFETSDHSLRDSFGSESGGDPPAEAAAIAAPSSEGNTFTKGGRKDHEKENPVGSGRDRRRIKNCDPAPEQRPAETTERLKEADSRAATKIESLESGTVAAEQGAVGGKNQSGAIRTLGKKLIRQAAVIKKLKEAAAQYKMRLGAMEEEMAMQDERDSQWEEEYAKLQEKYDSVKEQKVKMGNLIQENAEEIADLKNQAEKATKRITAIMRIGAMEEEMAMQDERDAQREEEFAKLQEKYDSVNEQKVEMENLLQENAEEIAELKSQAEKATKRITAIMRIRAMEEEMAMQDERDAQREEENAKLQEMNDELNEQKAKMENLLQENSKKMAELKSQMEKEAQRITGLALMLNQKDATLDRVTKEACGNPRKISDIEDELEEKNSQVDSRGVGVEEEQSLVENMEKALENANAEKEELRREHSLRKTVKGTADEGGEGDEGDARRQPVLMSWIQGVGEVTGLKTLELELKLKRKEATLDRATKERSEKSLKIAELEDELEEKNSQVDSMREKLKEERLSLENMKMDLESANDEKEGLRRELFLPKAAEGAEVKGGGGEESATRRKSVWGTWIQGVGEVTGLKTLELELKLKQKEATLESVKKEGSNNYVKIAELKDELEGKNSQVDSMREKLKGERLSVENLMEDLESANAEIEELRHELASCKTAEGTAVEGGEGGESTTRRKAVLRNWMQGVSEVTGLKTLELELKLKEKEATLDKVTKEGSDKIAKLEDELEEKNSQVESMEEELEAGRLSLDNMKKDLESANANHEETIKALRSEMVKMSSTYKQDSYLKRKEIVKLKQKNAEGALERRGLEKALMSVAATQNGGHSGGFNSHQTPSRRMSLGMMVSKDEARAAAPQARVGGLAPYDFLSVGGANRRDSKLVMNSTFTSTLNVFDKADKESGEERKGEFPEEC